MAIEKMGPQALVETKKYESLKERNQAKVDYVRRSSKNQERSFSVTLSKESARKSAHQYENKQNGIKKNAEIDLKKVDDKMKKDVKRAGSEYQVEVKRIKREFNRGQKEVQKKYDRDSFKLRQTSKHVVT